MVDIYSKENPVVVFSKLNSDAILPTKRDEDGCYDLYASWSDADNYYISPHSTLLIPTGIASAFSDRYRIELRERGSNVFSGLMVMAGQIDSGYRGEWFVALYNSKSRPVILAKDLDSNLEEYQDCDIVDGNKAICQFAIEEVPVVEISEVTYDELISCYLSKRRKGKLGSSGK